MCRFHNDNAPCTIAVSPHRLPRSVIPRHYNITLSPDLAKSTFDGQVIIDVSVTEPCSEIVLNSVQLNILEAKVYRSDGTTFKPNLAYEPANERLVLKLAGFVGKGRWKIDLKFSGILNNELKGFYRSTYKDATGQEQIIACTQFEATDARRCFPCFDEPNLKATFQSSLITEAGLTAISNMRVIGKTILPNNKIRFDYAKTPKMSTYLVAYVVGNLEATEPLDVDGVPIRILCVPGKLHLTKFALECAAFSLRYYTRYFKKNYFGDKIDFIAIPDFAAGAMENTGCIPHREALLLVDENNASQNTLDRIAEIVSHELSHQWFGNLVTMNWWNGLWLNEAFATFAAYKAVDAWKKSWAMWDKFGLDRRSAMAIDALASTRPIEFPVNHPSEANAMFDVLTYEKGASVLRMLEQYLGESKFQKGLRLYMRRHAYGNTEGSDLWSALSETADDPLLKIAEIMHEWIYKPGFPELSVTEHPSTWSDELFEIEQKPFKFLAEAVDPNMLWTVPVFYKAKMASGEFVEHRFLMSTRGATVAPLGKYEWVVVNAGGHSFVRVGYSKSLADKLGSKALTELSVIERFNLLSDAWARSKAGSSSVAEFIDLAFKFKAESDPTVWSAILGPLATIKDLLPENKRTKFETELCEFLKPIYERLGWQKQVGESVLVSNLRAQIIASMAILANDATVQAKAQEALANYFKDHNSLDANLLSTVVNICVQQGDSSLYDKLYSLYKTARTPQESQIAISNLAHFKDLDLAKRSLDQALDPLSIRTQDAPFLVASMFSNELAGSHTWEFVKTNFDKLSSLYPVSGLHRLFQAIASLDNNPELESDIVDFFENRDLKGGEKALSQALESLRINIMFRARESANVLARFEPIENQQTSDQSTGAPADMSAN